MQEVIVALPVTQSYALPQKIDLVALQPALLAWLDFCREVHYTVQCKKISIAIKYDVMSANSDPVAILNIIAHTTVDWCSKNRTKYRKAKGLPELPKGVSAIRALLPSVFQAKLSNISVENLCQVAMLIPEFSAYMLYHKESITNPELALPELVAVCQDYKSNMLRWYLPAFDLFL